MHIVTSQNVVSDKILQEIGNTQWTFKYLFLKFIYYELSYLKNVPRKTFAHLLMIYSWDWDPYTSVRKMSKNIFLCLWFSRHIKRFAHLQVVNFDVGM